MSILSPPAMPHMPAPHDPADAERWKHTRLRRRMLGGAWEQDLNERLIRMLGPVRRAIMPPADDSPCALAVISRELSTIYLSPPTIRHADEARPDVAALIGDEGAIAATGLWHAMLSFQALVIGCRQYLMRVEVGPDGSLGYLPIPPDEVVVTASRARPNQPTSISWLNLREGGPTGLRWVWDQYDLRDPENPSYRVLDTGTHNLDISDEYLPGPVVGATYPYRVADGRPFLPFVVYSAEKHLDAVFTPYAGKGLVTGSLHHAVLMSAWQHLVLDASWKQIYSVNAVPVGLETRDANGNEVRQEVITDPASLLAFEAIQEGMQPTVGQLQAAGDPEGNLRAIQSYAAQLVADAGVSDSDIHRMSNDPRSGVAISLTNEGKRRAQRRFTPSFRDADQRLVAMSAALMNRATGTTLPEGGYSAVYAPIELSPAEVKERREDVLARLEARLISRADAYRELNPGLTRAQAETDLAAIDAGNTERPEGA